MTILALDSNSDELTRRGSQYREAHVYPHFITLGHPVTRFTATPPPGLRDRVKVEAKKDGLKYITGVGHGDGNTAFTGNSMEELYGLNNYEPEEVEGKIIHFLSCGIGNTLGPDLVDKGCVAFFGYGENFAFLEDVADIFFECDSEIDRALADGAEAKVVFDRVITLFDRHISELRSQKKHYQAIWLRFNRDNLCAPSKHWKWGDESAKLT